MKFVEHLFGPPLHVLLQSDEQFIVIISKIIVHPYTLGDSRRKANGTVVGRQFDWIELTPQIKVDLFSVLRVDIASFHHLFDGELLFGGGHCVRIAGLAPSVEG